LPRAHNSGKIALSAATSDSQEALRNACSRSENVFFHQDFNHARVTRRNCETPVYMSNFFISTSVLTPVLAHSRGQLLAIIIAKVRRCRAPPIIDDKRAKSNTVIAINQCEFPTIGKNLTVNL